MIKLEKIIKDDEQNIDMGELTLGSIHWPSSLKIPNFSKDTILELSSNLDLSNGKTTILLVFYQKINDEFIEVERNAIEVKCCSNLSSCNNYIFTNQE